MMHENLEKVAGAAQSYLDMLEKTLRAFPGANQALAYDALLAVSRLRRETCSRRRSRRRATAETLSRYGSFTSER
jgi:hypothetical protein